MDYDKLVPYKFKLDFYQYSFLMNDILLIERKNDFYSSIKCNLILNLLKINNYKCDLVKNVEEFKAWPILHNEIKKHINIHIDFSTQDREMKIFQFNREYVDLLSEFSNIIFIPLQDITIHYNIFKNIDSKLVTDGTEFVEKGECLYIKPNTYISSRQIIDYIIIRIGPEYIDDFCLFKIAKYDDIFLAD
jgi:hypothetical protein